jgi:hypothetical protein
MSAGPARATRASGSSVAGLTVANCRPSAAGTNSPPVNRPYSAAIVTISRYSGAGAYSQPGSADTEVPGASGMFTGMSPNPG